MLLAVEVVAPGIDPQEEEWGWTFGVRVHCVRFWINLRCSFQQRKTWIIGIEPSSSLWGAFRKQRTRSAEAALRNAVDSALASTQEITVRRRLDKHPQG
jgi:hypothetical protein